MRFVWDHAKRLANIRKHGIDFIDAVAIFEGDILTIEDNRVDYNETRLITLGLFKGHVMVVVHTEEKELIRIISVRKATRYEEKRYFKEIAD